MLPRLLGIVLMALIILFPATATGNDKAERVDAFGDPLPPEAVRRIGSVHFRPGDGFRKLIVHPDGKTLISSCNWLGRTGSACIWESSTGRLLHRLPGKADRHFVYLSASGILAGTVGDGIRLWDPLSGRELRRLRGKKYDTVGLGISPDGKTLATCDLKEVHLWDEATGEEIAAMPLPRTIFGVVSFFFTSDNQTLIAWSYLNSKVHLWEKGPKREHREIEIGAGEIVDAFALSDDCRLLAAACRDHKAGGPSVISVWNVADGKKVRQWRGTEGLIHALAISPDGKRIASGRSGYGASEGNICLWDAASGNRLHSFEEGDAYSLAFSRDGKVLFGGETLIRRWDVETGKEIQRADGCRRPILSVALSGDGRRLASSSDEDLRIWDAATGQLFHRFRPKRGLYRDCTFSPDGKRVAAVNTAGTIHLWDADTGVEVRVIHSPGAENPLTPGQKGERLTAVAFASDGKSLFTSSAEGAIRRWDISTGKQLWQAKREQISFETVLVSADGRLVFAAGKTREGTLVRAWETNRAEELPRLTAEMNARLAMSNVDRFHVYNPARLALSADGRMLAVNREKTISVWEIASGKERLRLSGQAEPRLCTAFSPDGRLFASACQDSTLRLWDLATGTELRLLSGHRGNVKALTFSPDGKLLYSGGDDTCVLVWDLGRMVGRGLPAVPRLDAQTAWNDLASGDAAQGYRAIHALRADPGMAVPLLNKHLRPAAPVEDKHLTELIRNLDSDVFAVRDNAFRKLEKLGEAAEPVLRRALQGTPGLEVRRRVEELLEKLACPTGDNLRALRAVEVLEQIGSSEARRRLRELACGASEARLTRDARASLDRLARRSEK